MTTVWKRIDNIEHADIHLFNQVKIKTIRDNTNRTFFFSLSDIFTHAGYMNSYKTLKTDIYNRYYTPTTYGYLPDHIFISRSDMPHFLSSALPRISSMAKRDTIMRICQKLVKSYSEAYLLGDKESDPTFSDGSFMNFNDHRIKYIYVNGRMMLHFRNMYQALGFSARSNFADSYVRFGEIVTINNQKARYIPVHNLPAISVGLSYADKLMELYRKSCKISSSIHDNATGDKSLVVYRNKGIAIYEGQVVIPIKVIDDEVHYKLAAISKAYGLARTSEGMAKQSVNTDDGYYITINSMKRYINNTPMAPIMKKTWQEFVKKMA